MKPEDVTAWGERYAALGQKLEACSAVVRFDTPDEKEALSLAYGLLDIEESCRALSGNLIKRLVEEQLSPEETAALLVQIGEELRHILYHVRDSRYFASLDER